MELEVLNQNGSGDTKVSLAEGVFNQEFNQDLVHQLVNTYIHNSHQRTKGQKNRSAVRGGGKKPWKQKGTGRARAGTIRSPIWRGGGVPFAAVPRDYSKKINKKMYRAAIRSILSELYRQDRIIGLAKPTFEAPKTKVMAKIIKDAGLDSVLIILDEMDTNIYLSARNIPHVEVVTVKEINPVVLLRSDKVAITPEALSLIEAWVK